MKLFFSRVASPYEEVENVEVRKRKCRRIASSPNRKCVSETRVGSGRDISFPVVSETVRGRPRYLVARTEVRKWFPDSSCVGGAACP